MNFKVRIPASACSHALFNASRNACDMSCSRKNSRTRGFALSPVDSGVLKGAGCLIDLTCIHPPSSLCARVLIAERFATVALSCLRVNS